MTLEVLEGQTKGGYFSYSIFDPSVNQCTGHRVQPRVLAEGPVTAWPDQVSVAAAV